MCALQLATDYEDSAEDKAPILPARNVTPIVVCTDFTIPTSMLNSSFKDDERESTIRSERIKCERHDIAITARGRNIFMKCGRDSV